jgi:hypothetical protein
MRVDDLVYQLYISTTNRTNVISPEKSAGCRTLYGSPRDGDDMPSMDAGNDMQRLGFCKTIEHSVLPWIIYHKLLQMYLEHDQIIHYNL